MQLLSWPHISLLVGVSYLPMGPMISLHCMGECIKNADCENFVIRPSTGKCALKKANVSPPIDDPDRNRGTSSCACFDNNRNVVSGSADKIGSVAIMGDPGDCQAVCAVTLGCKGFTMDTGTGECQMWEGGFQMQDEDGVIFGPPVC